MNFIDQKLRELRFHIRLIVALDACVCVAIWLQFAFWISFLLDWLPVQMGVEEMPFFPRALVLTGITGMTVMLLLRRGLSRLTASLPDESLKLLIERRYPEFQDRLITTGVLDADSRRQSALLELARSEVNQRMQVVRPWKVIRWQSLIFSSCLAAALGLGVLFFSLFARDLATRSFQRTFLLSNQPFPRSAHFVELKVFVSEPDAVIDDRFGAREFVLERGDPVVIGVRSSLKVSVTAAREFRNRQFEIPQSCRMNYRCSDGRTGVLTLSAGRRTESGSVTFTSTDDVLEKLDCDLQFWVSALDLTIGPFSVEVTDRPVVQDLKRATRYPKYLADSSAVWTDEVVPLVNGESLPLGTRIQLRVQTDRRLNQVLILDESDRNESDRNESDRNESDRNESGVEERSLKAERGGETIGDKFIADNVHFYDSGLEFDLTVTQPRHRLRIILQDVDGLFVEQPVPIYIAGLADRRPTVTVARDGVSDSITRNAKIDLLVSASDEFGVQSVAAELSKETPGLTPTPDDGEANEITKFESVSRTDFPWKSQEEMRVRFDLLELRRQGKISLDPSGNEEVRLKIETEVKDFCPDNEAASGQGYEFRVVSESRFLQLIERREAAMRTRLENIHDELDLAGRLLSSQITAGNPDTADGNSTVTLAVVLQRVRMQLQKSALEILGVAQTLDGMVDEMNNNRVPVEVKQERLVTQVSRPLRRLGETRLPTFTSELANMASQLRAGEASVTMVDLQQIYKRHVKLNAELDEIINRMAQFESYGELLESVRQLIETQKRLIDETKKRRNQKAFDSLLD